MLMLKAECESGDDITEAITCGIMVAYSGSGSYTYGITFEHNGKTVNCYATHADVFPPSGPSIRYFISEGKLKVVELPARVKKSLTTESYLWKDIKTSLATEPKLQGLLNRILEWEQKEPGE